MQYNIPESCEESISERNLAIKMRCCWERYARWIWSRYKT